MNKKRLLLITLILILFCSYLHLSGEGYLLTIVHSMMNDTNTGGFVIKEGSSVAIDCAEFHKKFPQYISTNNVMTEPISLNNDSGLYERFIKADKSIIDNSYLSWKDRMAISMSSSEPKCARSLGSFIKSVVSVTK